MCRDGQHCRMQQVTSVIKVLVTLDNGLDGVEINSSLLKQLTNALLTENFAFFS